MSLSNNETVNKTWGYYEVLESNENYKLKKLVVFPKKSLSLQRHFFRSEVWFVKSGKGVLTSIDEKTSNKFDKQLNLHDYTHIEKKQWHKLSNPFDDECVIIEIQYGEKCEECDIERIYE